MGSGRESQSPFRRLKIYLKFKRKNPKYHKLRWVMEPFKNLKNPELRKLFWGDTFGGLICFVIGHDKYIPDPDGEPNEKACKRCHIYIN